APGDTTSEAAKQVVPEIRDVDLPSVVEHAAGDRCAVGPVPVRVDRGNGTARARGRRLKSLAHRPAEVVSRVHDVDLLEGVLADVGNPEQPGARVEGEAEGIAQAGGEHEVGGAPPTEKRIAGRGTTVAGDAQDLPFQAGRDKAV